MSNCRNFLVTLRAWTCLLALTILSCTSPDDSDGADNPHIGLVRQAITDTDSDGLDDTWETASFGNLSQTGSGDFDSDGMTNLEEYTYGFDPTSADDAFSDLDGDRYPNVFELRNGSDPGSSSSTPTATATVNGAGGGTHTNVSAAVTAVNGGSAAYPIIAIAAGNYTGTLNSHPIFNGSGKRYLVIGLAGAATTVIDGSLSTWGWDIYNKTVVASVTIKRTWCALWVSSAAGEVRFNDVIIRDNAGSSYAAGVDFSATKLYISGSAFLNNAGTTSSKEHIWVGGGTATITNTAVYGSSTNPMLVKAGSATLVTNYSFVKGQTLAGTGNLAGTADPKFQPDLHIRWDSALRRAGIGASSVRSAVDMDGDIRPSTTTDIGADQFRDSDFDDLEDGWELSQTGTLTTLTGRTQDADSDGLDNEHEQLNGTNPTVADTDGDGIYDGDEVNVYGTNPLSGDSDGDGMPDGWEVTHGLSATVANAYDDADGDRYPNIFEYAYSSDPSNSSSQPTPSYIVNGAGGGTHTTIRDALTAANAASGTYKVIAIAAGTYSGPSNIHFSWDGSGKKYLIIGLDGASKTIVDANALDYGWDFYDDAVIASLTIQRTKNAVFVNSSTIEVRINDCVIRDNGGTTYAGGVDVPAGSKLFISGSTFQNNVSTTSTKEQIWIGAGAATITNTVVYGTSTKAMLAKASGATLTTNYTLVKGQTLTGTGNLAGSTDPKLSPDLHILWDSPLRASGGSAGGIRPLVDMDGEPRPTTAPDIGADQFNDEDHDGLADQWETANAGDLTTLTGRAQDADSDGLDNEHEYYSGTSPTVADTDGDGILDGDEVNVYGTNPLSGDSDGDGMPDGWEVTHGLSATVANAYDDADGDRYPNIFEYAYSSDPSNSSSQPTPSYIVNGAGGGTHTTIRDALTAANAASGTYKVIAIAAGTYSGPSNIHLRWDGTGKKYLIIGLDGAAKTIVDANTLDYGWDFYDDAVIASLTIQRTKNAVFVNSSAIEVRINDCVIRDNGGTTYAGGVDVPAGSKLFISGSTFQNNVSTTSTKEQIWIGAGAATITNTVVYGTSTKTMLAKASGATLTTNYTLVKGQTLTGTGNLVGSTDPKLRSDLHLRSDSPLRGAGGPTVQSRLDIDGELRPSSSPDIGADQFNDADVDDLPDAYEIVTFGGLATVDGAADDDFDGLTNAEEHDLETDWQEADSDRDGVDDGLEVLLGMNPLVADSDDLADDVNHDGLIDSIGVQLGHQPDDTDNDGDGVSNTDELLMCTDPLRADTDGDGVSDIADRFPHDPLMSSLISDPGDVTPPVIRLESPWYAVEQ